MPWVIMEERATSPESSGGAHSPQTYLGMKPGYCTLVDVTLVTRMDVPVSAHRRRRQLAAEIEMSGAHVASAVRKALAADGIA